jgi:hypothetical protein
LYCIILLLYYVQRLILETVVLTVVYCIVLYFTVLYCVVFVSFGCVLFFLTCFMSDCFCDIMCGPQNDIYVCMYVCMYISKWILKLIQLSKIYSEDCHKKFSVTGNLTLRTSVWVLAVKYTLVHITMFHKLSFHLSTHNKLKPTEQIFLMHHFKSFAKLC